MLDYFIVRQRDVPCRHIFSLSLHFNIISVTDTTITNSDIPLDFDLPILSYNFEYVPTPLSAWGVGMYIDNGFKYIVVERT